MNYNKLGKTDLEVSEIGLGTEHLFDQPEKTVKSVIHKAIENKINYFDVIFSVQHYLEKLALSFQGFRDQIIITGHMGTSEFEGRVQRNRSLKESRKAFLMMLSTLKIDYVDILNIQLVLANEFKKIMNPGGLLELAISFQKDGKARYLGLSTHDTSIAKQATRSGKFDMIMFPINLANHGLEGRTELLSTCSKYKIGLVAIKPFAAGKLLKRNQTTYIAKYQTGGLSFKKKIPPYITSAHCINYVKSVPEVSLVLIGVKNVQELMENLKYSKTRVKTTEVSSLIDLFK